MLRPLALFFAVAILALPLAAEAGHGPGNRTPHRADRHHLDYPDRDCWVEPVRHGREIRNEIRCRQPSYGPPGWAAVPHRHPAPQPPQTIVVPTAPPSGPTYGAVYQSGDGRYCREYNTTATIGGRQERLYGTACMMPDGSWQFDG